MGDCICGIRGVDLEYHQCYPSAIQRLETQLAEKTAALQQREEELKEARRQLTYAQENNHKRNVELDALHYVWCDGSCESGVHRFGEHPPLTAEIVAAAELNARRLRRKYVNLSGKELPGTTEARLPTWMQAERDIHEAYVRAAEKQLKAKNALLRRVDKIWGCYGSSAIIQDIREALKGETK